MVLGNASEYEKTQTTRMDPSGDPSLSSSCFRPANAVSLACCVRPLAQPVAGRCPFCGIFTSPFGGWSWLRCDCCGVPSFKCCTWFVLGEVSESGSRLPEIFRDVKI